MMLKQNLFVLVFAGLALMNASFTRALPKTLLDEITGQDVSFLWKSHRPALPASPCSEDSITWIPLGFIGEDYQRLYIHFESIIRNPERGNHYLVYGKSRVKNNVCPFQGMFSIEEATSFTYQEFVDDPCVLLGGGLAGTYTFFEDPETPYSGVFEGDFVTDIYLGSRGEVHYDNLMRDADGWSNNSFFGTWTRYGSTSPKTCNWGDARIPGAEGLDGGACCFHPKQEYVKAGWQTYMDAYWNDDTVSQETADAALAEEKRKWWVD